MDQERSNENKLKKFASLDNPDDRKKIRKCITKIMNTLSFRKLAGKTQVILSLTGPDVRTRLTHTIEVAKIAKDICIELKLNAELAEAIALAHDIGHTPFGHVGERTLREIMCGCDTLGDKVRDCDFANSGFKHNLQSFRVLKDIECVDTNSNGDFEHQDIWPYIFWGALAHTNMTYAKAYSGMDDEILISSKHCDWVYVCHYDKKKECKYNIQKKKKREVNKKEICKPWFCADLPVIKKRDEVDINYLGQHETSREYIKKGPINKKCFDWIYCSHKCYLAQLWKHKLASKRTHKEYPYLYDHPFPNSFYAESFYSYFNNMGNDTHQGFISLEAQIVCQADEIAQRQQDLEDGINTGLLPFNTAKDDVKNLIEKFNYTNLFNRELDEIHNSENLGKLLVDFYKEAIVEQTRHNFKDFVYNTEKVEINIFSLMNILFSVDGDNKKKTKWIIEELNELSKASISKHEGKYQYLEDNFRVAFDPIYLCLMSYDHLERCLKRDELIDYKEDMITIFSMCIKVLNGVLSERISELCNQIPTHAEELCGLGIAKDLSEIGEKLKIVETNTVNRFESGYRFIRALDLLRDYFHNYYKFQSSDFFKMENKRWKTIGWLRLSSFFSLYHIFRANYEKNNKGKLNVSDLKDLKIPTKYNPEDHAIETFTNWKKLLKNGANKVLSNLVAYTDISNSDDKRGDALDDFEENQRNTILKSEPVEKNDGKASYMIRRLFKAYIANSHRLPDLGLKYILIALIENESSTELLKSEKNAFKEISNKLQKTMLNNTQSSDEIKRILEDNLLEFRTDDTEFNKLKKGKSNEFIAALEKRKKLSKFFKELIKERQNIKENLN